jgi:N-acetylmuramic acid 6-phosphate etherase
MSVTEQASQLPTLSQLSTLDILTSINAQDATIAQAIASAIPQIEALTTQYIAALERGNRVFYIGAGTSGRLGIVDASEIPPTYGVPHDLVIGIIAGGDTAIRRAVEFAEDSSTQAWLDLETHHARPGDLVIGIAASGRTPYVVEGLKMAAANGLTTGCITSNPDSALAAVAQYPIQIITGPEIVTGSTRMKAGTAQKLVLNMLSTAAMVKTGRVKGSLMVFMQLTNNKLVERGRQMLVAELSIPYELATTLLETHGSVAKAMEAYTS